MKDMEKKALSDEQVEQVSGGRRRPRSPYVVEPFRDTADAEEQPATYGGAIYNVGMIDTQY